MSDLANPKDETIDVANKAMTAFVEATKVATKLALVAAGSFFGWPFVSQLTDFILDSMAKAIEKVAITSTDFMIIDKQTAAEYHAYMDELSKLKGGDNVQLEKTRDALAKFVHMDA